MATRLYALILIVAIVFSGCIGEQAQVDLSENATRTDAPPEVHFPPAPIITAPSETASPETP